MAATTSTHTAVVTLPTDTQIVITREFAAPKHLVYRALTTPELIERWWSGERGPVTSAEVDLRVGGTWRYLMLSHDGTAVGFHGEYREIVENELIVCTEVYEGIPDGDDNPAVCTYVLTEEDGRTTMRVTTDMANKADRDMLLEYGMEAGMQEAYDLLEQIAASLR